MCAAPVIRHPFAGLLTEDELEAAYAHYDEGWATCSGCRGQFSVEDFWADCNGLASNNKIKVMAPPYAWCDDCHAASLVQRSEEVITDASADMSLLYELCGANQR